MIVASTIFPIDTKEQNFSCQFLLEFILPEGTDPSTDKDFPVDTHAGDDFKLSARWYLNKIEPQNMSGDQTFELLDSSSTQIMTAQRGLR